MRYVLAVILATLFACSPPPESSDTSIPTPRGWEQCRDEHVCSWAATRSGPYESKSACWQASDPSDLSSYCDTVDSPHGEECRRRARECADAPYRHIDTDGGIYTDGGSR
jgi:hypothetical protein